MDALRAELAALQAMQADGLLDPDEACAEPSPLTATHTQTCPRPMSPIAAECQNDYIALPDSSTAALPLSVWMPQFCVMKKELLRNFNTTRAAQARPPGPLAHPWG